MRIKVICYKLHTLSLKLQQLHIHTSSCFQTLNLLHVSICKMFLFWDVSHETKQKKNSNKLQRVCSLDGKLSSTVTWSTQFSKSVAQGNLRALRDRLCPRTNMQAFLCPNEGWCFYYPSIIFHNMCSWKLGNVTQISSVLAGEYSVMWCIRPVAWTHKIIFDGLQDEMIFTLTQCVFVKLWTMAVWRKMSFAQTLCYLHSFLMAGLYPQNSRSVVSDIGNNPYLYCGLWFWRNLWWSDVVLEALI